MGIIVSSCQIVLLVEPAQLPFKLGRRARIQVDDFALVVLVPRGAGQQPGRALEVGDDTGHVVVLCRLFRFNQWQLLDTTDGISNLPIKNVVLVAIVSSCCQ